MICIIKSHAYVNYNTNQIDSLGYTSARENIPPIYLFFVVYEKCVFVRWFVKFCQHQTLIYCLDGSY